MIIEDEVRRSLAAVLPPAGEPGPWDGQGYVEAGRSYLELLAPLGWIAPLWPEEYGGRGATEAEAALVIRVLAEFAAPDLYPFTVGLSIVGPTLLREGSPEQRERWCRRILSGADIWCQMFSEPGAGSDLAGLSTRAMRCDDGWMLTGQKVWTSRGEWASHGFCLARSNPDVPKHAGITMFALDMAAPGVTVRPLVQINGDSHFSEVFMDEAVVPDDARIGAADHGWAVALTALGFERSTTVARQVAPDPLLTPPWLRELIESGVLADPDLRRAAVDTFVLAAANSIFDNYSAELRADGATAAVGSVGKLRHSATFKAVAEIRSRAARTGALLADDPTTYDPLTAPSMSIRGGTDQIQRNIIGERVLGLPRDPHRDNDIPWNQRGRAAGR